MKTICASAMAACLPSLVPCAQAQLIIDRAGARQALYGSTLDGDLLKGKSSAFSFDSKEKSISLSLFEETQGFLSFGEDKTQPLPPDEKQHHNWLYILRAKVKAADGYEELLKFNKLPHIELSFLVNYTQTWTDNLSWFANVRMAYRHEEYEVFDLATGKFNKPTFDTVDAQLSGGLLYGFPGENFFKYLGINFSAGYLRASNYEALPQVEVSDIQRTYNYPGGITRIVTSGAKKVRMGTLINADTIPAEIGLTTEIPISPKLVEKIPFVPGKKDTTYALILSPYGRYQWNLDAGGNEHGVGIVATMKSRKDMKGSDGYPLKTGLHQVKYPFSVFAERKDAFGNNPSWQTGVNVVWHF